MGIIYTSEYQAILNRLNALREKHKISTSLSISAPTRGTAITASKMNELLNATVGSKWISSSLGSSVSRGTLIRQTTLTDIENKLAQWEATCIHDADKNNEHDCDDDGDQCGDYLACYDNFEGTGDNISNFTDDNEDCDYSKFSPDK